MNSRTLANFAFLILILIALIHLFPSNRAPMSLNTSETIPNSLRLVIVSDTHRRYRMPIPPGDVFIHCGDSELTGKEMDKWASQLPHTHKLVVCGNMDSRLQRAKEKLHHVTYLQDTSVTINGIKIHGSPWTPLFVGVFQLSDESEAKQVWEKVPEDVDVLVTHGPPAGILDRTSRGKSVGDKHLLSRVEHVKPRVHCFGHVHESYGSTSLNGTLFCNAAVFHGQQAFVVDVPVERGLPPVVKAGGSEIELS